MGNMNESVNACDNFYQFACGGYINSQDSVWINKVEILENIDNKKIDAALMKDIEDHEPRIIKLIKIYHQACRNTSKYTQ